MQSIVASLEREFMRASGRGFTFLDGENAPERLTFQALHLAARSVAAGITAAGGAGQRVLIACPHDLGYVKAVCGTFHADAIAVPAFPPNRKRHVERVLSIIADCKPAVAISSAAAIGWIAEHAPHLLHACTWLAIEDLERAFGDDCRTPAQRGEGVAILQYTSGSTGSPKGVMVTHGNIDANCRMLDVFAEPDDIVVGWLPFFHDMGLVGSILKTIYSGIETVFLPPARFLQQPLRWLQAVSDHRGTVSGAPNFAYDLCAEKIGAEQRAQLDLSSWRRTFNGAEPVRATTIDRFRRTFAPCGFRPEALQPCYGMAEATLLVSVNQASDAPGTVRRLSPDELKHDRVVEAAPGDSASEIVQCGSPPAAQCRVVDPNTLQTLGSDKVGEVWIAGPHVAAGYWNKQEGEADRAFAARTADGDGPFFRTGDLGFFDRDGGLFITGRLKDLIIDNGRNIHPTDIEATAGAAHPAIEGQSGAAFQTASGAIILCQEVARSALQSVDTHALRTEIVGQVARNQDLLLSRVVLLKPGSIPRTSSGKVQRLKCHDAYENGALTPLAERKREASSTPSQGDGTGIIITAIAEMLDDPARVIHSDSSFADLGIDSVKLVELATRLERTTRRRVSPAQCFDYPTPTALAGHLFGTAGGDDAACADRGPADPAIAIVGMACRFPGADDPQRFWARLEAGYDAVRSAPAGTRWQDLADGAAPVGTNAARWRALIDDVDAFDAGFFGIAPREAALIDPQQRLLLELAWEAIEDAGRSPASLAGSDTGVFVGISGNDYAEHARQQSSDLYVATGNAASIAANRISYVLDLGGPSLSIDTACSSSLVAVHQACQSIRAGDCRLALAAGVNLLLSRRPSEIFASAGMLSPNGRCASFSDDADGYVRAEGCGVIVLKPLEDARRDGDRVHAVIAGSAVNQDGRSNGLTAPNGRSQEKVIRLALDRAGIEPDAISMVEAHGSATPLGDPVEYGALFRIFGERAASAPPCFVTSVKANVGHLEAAAGMAGLIKALLCLRHGTIPAHPHFRRANPHLDADPSGPLRIAVDATPIPPGSGPRHAGVSSFGFGGTNAHIVLREPDAVAAAKNRGESAQLLVASARTPAALEALLRRYADVEGDLADICRTAAIGRSHFASRAAFVSTSLDDLKRQVWTYRAPPAHSDRGSLAFLFSGQGQSFAQAGAELLAGCEIFRAAMIEADTIFARELGFSILEKIYGPGDPEKLRDTLVMQPCLFSLEVALGRFWADRGIRPNYLCGHSLGEYAAAQFGGVLSLADAAKLVATRARLMNGLDRVGAMASVFAPLATIAPLVAESGDALTIAADNGPAIVTVSGRADRLDALLATLAGRGIRASRLPVSHAFHSPLMRPIVAEFAAVARAMRYAPSSIPIAANLSGEISTTALSNPDYWTRTIEAPVQFRQVLAALHGAGARSFLEIGPGSTLTSLGQRSGFGDDCMWLQSLSTRTGSAAWLDACAHLYERGYDLDWTAHYRTSRGGVASLPTYPFERASHWVAARQNAPRAHACEHAYEIAWHAQADEPAAIDSSEVIIVTGWHGGDLLNALRAELPDARHAALADIDRLLTADRSITRIIHLLSGDPLRAGDEAADLLTLVQRLAAADRAGHAPRLWLVEPAGAATTSLGAGFGLSVAIETPRIWGGTILVGSGTSARHIVDAVGRNEPDMLLLRDGEQLVRRLVSMDGAAGRAAAVMEGAALIVGGLGGLGLATAGWLAANGCKTIVLTGQRAPDPAADARLAALRAAGAEVRYEIADICDMEQMRRVIGAIDDLRLVFHAAGAVGVATLETLDRNELWRTIRPKLDGAAILDQLLRDANVRLILYSSIASVWGSRNQAPYAAANACLDRLAQTRHAAGLPTLSVNWGPWRTGMVGAGHEADLATIGIRAFEPDAAVANLSWLLACETPHAVIVDADWQTLAAIFAIHRKGDLFGALAGPVPAAQPESGSMLRAELQSAPAGLRGAMLRTYLTELIGSVMRLPPGSAVQDDQPLFALGLDSLMTIEANRRIEADLGCTIDATFVLDHPTIEKMSAHLLDCVPDLAAREEALPAAPRAAETAIDAESIDPQIAAELQRLDQLLGSYS